MMETLCRVIKATYQQETPKSVQIQLINGAKIWLPKRYIDSQYYCDMNKKQEFTVERYILDKIGFRLETDTD